MEPERWKKVENAFGQALERPAEQRAVFLDRLCGGDAEVRREVEALLEANDEAGTFLARPAWDGSLDPTRESLSETPNLVGPYRLVRKIGEGGMSVVYLAVRADAQFQRRVAIKFLRQNLQSKELEQRFATERQVLAGMDHPSIAKLHDAASTDGGRSYVVMEYIEGEPLDEYCDRHRLTIGERLALFRKVCSAVHYAHQSLVVHRDLKPSNILVTEAGVPKLLDFGIAKLLKPELSAQGSEPTVPWHRLMTPDYASPEQMQGKPITTASDVYSLGVILYRLLTGHLPHRFAGRSPRQIERVLADEEPEKPSEAIGQATAHRVSRARDVRPAELRRRLAGDLDNIVALALRKEPQRRYASAEQLSEDIGRYLAGLPVVARQDALGYRLGKFLRRNRAAVAIATAFFVMLLGSAVGLGILSTRLAQQRDEAQRERDRANQFAGFLEEIFEISDPDKAKGEDLTAREILDRAAERIERELGAQPEVQASLKRTIGNVYQRLGLYAEAELLLQSVLETRRRILGQEHVGVAESLTDLGHLQQARGDYEQAEQLYRQALDLRRRILADDHPEIGDSLSDLGFALRHQGHEQVAENLYQQALEIRRRSLGDDHLDVADSLNLLGDVLWGQGKYAAAEPLHRQALEIRRNHFGEDHLDVADSLNNLALVFREQGSVDQAEQYLLKALEIWRKLLGEDHQMIVLGLNNLASLAAHRGDYETATAFYAEGLERARRILDKDHPKLAYLLVGLGGSQCNLDDPQGGEQLLRQGIDLHRRNLPEGHWLIAWSESLLGECLTRLGRYEEAGPLLVQSYRSIAAQRPTDDHETAQMLARVVNLYETWGKPEDAAKYREMQAYSTPVPPED